MFSELTTAELYRYWQRAARWAADYKERSFVARKPVARLTHAENAHKWHAEQRLAADELIKRLTDAEQRATAAV